MAKSILQSRKECFICQRVSGLHKHHVFFGTSNRKNSETHGLWIWLCVDHHTGTHGVHNDRPLDLNLKINAQAVFEQNHSREEFREIFGKSYL